MGGRGGVFGIIRIMLGIFFGFDYKELYLVLYIFSFGGFKRGEGG